MPRAKPKPKDGLTKFQRYRRAQTNRGMKLLRVWVLIRRGRNSPKRRRGRLGCCAVGRKRRRP